MFTPRDQLERVPTFAEQAERPRTDPPTITPCDACGQPLSDVEALTRFRHEECDPPPLPPAALEVLDRIRGSTDHDRAEHIAGALEDRDDEARWKAARDG